MKQLTCNIHSIEHLSGDTRKVLLEIPAGEDASFRAGQYLEIVLPSKKCPFSIASRPGLDGLVELHVRPTPDSNDSVQIEALLDDGAPLVIEMPKGDCFLEKAPDNPLILIAASTGITQMKSIVEHLFETGFSHPIYLYWGVLKDTDLYLSALCESWEKQHANFHYIPVVSEPALSPAWKGRTGLVGMIALEDFDDLSNVTVFVSGGPAMVYATLDAFIAKGMPESAMRSDIFSYAPRAKVK
ncbi:MAG: CDP-6-deoxy-delta-3,4-glucoseen reductase [Pseudomonadales bacterium]|nr:CDP-6-deoxy-delta-3,4-glucoseen reductase [Pseudomonadales bacterium]